MLRQLCSRALIFQAIIESEVIIGPVVKLMRSFGIPYFSVHDSIIDRRIDQIIALDTLRNQFVNRVGIEPRLKVK